MKHWLSFRSVDAALLGDTKIPTRNQPQKVIQPKPRKAADIPTWPKTHTVRPKVKQSNWRWGDLGGLALSVGLGIGFGAVAFAALLAVCVAVNLFGCGLATVVPLVPNSGADIIKILTGKSCYPW